MSYHIDTGLVKDKIKESSECPLCAVQKIVEEQFLHEFLNDAVMEDNTRIKVGKYGFCEKHFDMLFARPNKLSVALQVRTRLDNMQGLLSPAKSANGAKKLAQNIEKSVQTCVLCDYVQNSMVKYYKTIAQMYLKEKEFYKLLLSSKGFCMKHYAELLRYSSYAGFASKNYLNILATVQQRAMETLQQELKTFCDKHDYRNALEPLGSAENALPNTRVRLYGEKHK